MKKTIYIFCLLGLVLAFNNVKAQASTLFNNPQVQCYNGNNSSIAHISPLNPAAVSYTWAVASPSGCAASVNTFSNGAATITYPCCGVYTITCFAFSASNALVNTYVQTSTVVCGGASITVSATSSSTMCSGSSVVLSASGGNTYTWSTGSTAPSIFVTPSVTTCYTVTGSNSNGCFGSAVKCVTVSQSPVISISGNGTICAGSVDTLRANGASTYTWYTSQGTFTGSTIVVTPSATTCYSVSGSNGTCIGYASRCINVTPGGSNPVINSNNFNICGGQSTVLYASGASSYTWFPGGSTSPSISVSPSVTTCYTLAGYGCSSVNYAVRCVTIGAAPVLSISGNGPICAGSGATLTAGGASSYTWYTAQGTFTGSTIVLTPTATSCYSLVGANGSCMGYSGGCVTVTPGSNPVINSNNFNICGGQSTILYASGASSYTWFPGGSTSPSISVSPSVTTCYTLAGYGCSSVNYAVRCVTVGAAPVLSISGNGPICSGHGATLTASGASSYTWYTSQGTFTGSTIVLTPSATTCYSLVGANGSCMGYSGGCVTVTPGSNPVINSNNFNICGGQSTVLYASGASSYTWFPGGSTSPSISVSPSVTTCYTLAGYGCSSVNYAVRCVTVGAAPVLSISGNGPICSGNGATLTASGASSYTWYTAQGTFTGSTIVLTPTATSCYSLVGANGSCMGYSGGCVTVTPGSFITISGNANICAGAMTILHASGASNYTWTPGGFSGDSIVVSPTVTTCYNVHGSSGSGCISSAIKCVTVQPNTPVSINGPNSICAGSNIVLVASGASSYTWLPGGSHSLSITATPSTNVCYTLSGTGCSGITSAVKCITVSPSPVLTVSGNTNICAGSEATLTASGASSYTWMTNQGTFNGSTIVLTPQASTCYSLMGSNGSGCLGFFGGCINVQGGNLTVSGNTLICAGSSATLIASGAQTYTWLPGGMVGSSIVVSPTATTCYTVIGNSSTGCGGSAGVCVYVTPRPTIFTSSGFFCAGQSGTITASGASTYTWLPFNLTGSSIVVTPSVSGCYTVSGTSTSGCVNSTVGCFSVVPSASITISGNNTNCSGAPTILTATGAQSYTWLPLNVTGATVSVAPLSSACYTVISNNFGCVSSAVKCLSVQPGPTVSVGGNNSLCAGSSTTLFANGASTYTWLPGNLTGPIVVVSPTASVCYTVVGTNSNGCIGLGYQCVQLTPRPTITTSSGFFCAGTAGILQAQGATSYTWLPFGLTGSIVSITPSVSTCYTVIGSNSSGCSNSAVGCFSVLPAPVITVVGNGTICAGSSTTLTAGGASSYTWIPTNTTGPNVVVSPTASTCYTVIGSNGGSCTSRVVKCVTVQSGAQLSISGANIICAGTSANLLASGANTYTWNTGSNSPFITITPSISTCYTVTGTTSGGCVGSAVKCISVQASPVVSIIGPTLICHGSTAVLSGSGAFSYLWSTGSTATVISVAPTTSTVYSVTGSNGNCSSVKSITVVVNPGPTVNIYRTDSIFNHDTIVCAGNLVHLNGSGAISYTWSTGATSTNIAVSPSVTTTYTLIGSYNGCSSSAQITLHVSACTGIAKNSENLQIGIYPNPASNNLTLQGDGINKINYTLYDVIGRELLKGEFTNTKNVDLSNYTNGTYIIRFESGSVTSYKKLVIEK